MKGEQGKKSENFLKQMADFISEGHALGTEQEKLEDDIKAAGIDPVQFSLSFRTFVEGAVQEELVKQRHALHEQRLRAQARIEERYSKIRDMFQRWTAQREKEMLARLDPRLAGVYYRNFRDSSDADKASMMEELELLEELERIVREEEKP